YGVIRPVHRTHTDTFFDFRDLSLLKQANEQLEEGASFRAVVRALLAERHGQLAFDFRIDAAPAKIRQLRRRAGQRRATDERPTSGPPKYDTARAEDQFRIASALDDGDPAKLEEAATAYRKALELDPYLVAALINL